VVETTGDAPAHALGGPLVDARGAVVGIVAGVDEGSASYVVPAEVARKVSDDLLALGRVEHCWLGIEGSDADQGDVPTGSTGSTEGVGGVAISKVVTDSPADHGDLRVGDVLVEMDGRTIGHLPDLMIGLRSRSPGDRIDATVVRDEAPTTLTVTLGEKPEPGA
jgi:S1-C subfamily serine protease